MHGERHNVVRLRCRGPNPGHPRDRREYSPLYYNDRGIPRPQDLQHGLDDDVACQPTMPPSFEVLDDVPTSPAGAALAGWRSGRMHSNRHARTLALGILGNGGRLPSTFLAKPSISSAPVESLYVAAARDLVVAKRAYRCCFRVGRTPPSRELLVLMPVPWFQRPWSQRSTYRVPRIRWQFSVVRLGIASLV